MVYGSHDLAVVAALADRIMVVYAGRVVEHGLTAALVQTPRHPYTRGLIQSIPDPSRPRRLIPMRGTGAGVGHWPAGCPFEPRWPQRVNAGATRLPSASAIASAKARRHAREPRCSRSRACPLFTAGRTPSSRPMASPSRVANSSVYGLVGESGSGK